MKLILVIVWITSMSGESLESTYYKYDDQGRPITPSQEELDTLSIDGGGLWNRLVFEDSPYLLQHAANPVNWYPWGKEAFQKAKKLNKPIFLSIGYTTCHWCHVMEHESFENDEVADLMNDAFVCIKVDREERPDIDNVYMEVTQMMNNRGGWPMTVIMTPDKQPFFSGTYFPKHSRGRRIGMMELIPQIKDAWLNRQDSLKTDAANLTARLQRNQINRTSEGNISQDVMDRAYSAFQNRYDEKRGGFGKAPKFPKAHDYSFLIKYSKRTGNSKALDMAEFSLMAMRNGGMYDQVGFGFHRYSTDATWLVPHFEKMLYDQAILVQAYLDAYQATGKQYYADVVDEILKYVLRDMTSREGGYYSAEEMDEKRDDIQHVYEQVDDPEAIEKEQKEMISNVFDFGEINVYETMTPRTEISAVSNTDSLEKVLHTFIDSGHSKLPVYENNMDNIIGVVYLYDLFHTPENINDVIKPVLHVPYTKPVMDLMAEFQSAHHALAIVLDEHGGCAGLITTEDLFEKLLGEFDDEFDEGLDKGNKMEDGSIVVNARMDWENFNSQFGDIFPKGEYETIGGYIISELGRIPNKGENLFMPIGQIVVINASARQIHQVQIYPSTRKNLK